MSWKRLGDICVAFDYGMQVNPSRSGKARLIRTADIGRDVQRLDFDTASYVPRNSDAPPRVPLREGDIVIARNGEGSIGNAALVPPNPPLAFHNHNLIRLRPVDPELATLLIEYMRTDHWRKQIVENSGGSSITSITAKRIRQLPVPMVSPDRAAPALAEFNTFQAETKKIQEELDRASEWIRSACDAAHSAALQGQLDRLPRNLEVDHVPAAERIQAVSGDSARSATVLPLGTHSAPWNVPDHWGWSTVGEEFRFHDGARRPVSKAIRSNARGSNPYYGASGVIDHVNFSTHSGSYLLVSEDGSNLRSRRSSIAFVVDGDLAANNHVHVLAAKRSLRLDFAALMINSTEVAHLLTGVAQPKLGQARLAEVPVLVPPIDEQRTIVETWSHFYESAVAAMSSTISASKVLTDAVEDKRATMVHELAEEQASKQSAEWFRSVQARLATAEARFAEQRKSSTGQDKLSDAVATLSDASRALGSASANQLLEATRGSDSSVDRFYVDLRRLVLLGDVSVDPVTGWITWIGGK